MAEKKVAVIGFGNIGTGVVDVLYHKGISGLKLVRVVDVDLERKRPVSVPGSLLSGDWREAVNDPAIDIIVELIGGIEPAKSIHLAALEKGKDVVTANKMLLAREGEQIFQFASRVKRRVGFRASFVGCHSLIHEFCQAGANPRRFRRIYAILNGTCNYVLSSMSREGKEFAEALREAQKEGYAESDPSDDIGGIDTANKIRIILNLISNSYRTVGDFPVEGIRDFSAADIHYAGELGYVVKLVGVIEQNEGTFGVAVHPALVPKASLLGSLEGAYNGTEVEDEFGVVSGLVAPGAGTYPTANAVVKDLLDIVEDRTSLMPTSNRVLPLGSPEAMERYYYLRFSVLDQPGVLAQICNIFWKYDISIAGVIQKGAGSRDFVPVVMTTYLAKEGDLLAAVGEVDKLEVVRARTRVMRILRTNA